MEEQTLNEIANLLTQSLKKQLEIKRPATAYGSPGIPGRPKSRGFSAPIASGRLIKDIQVKFVPNQGNEFPDLVVEMPIEGQFINDGRRPGKWPPLQPIDNWVKIKQGLRGSIRDEKGRFIKRKSLVYLIRRSIGLYGYGGTDFIIKGFLEVAPELSELYGDQAVEIIQLQLNQFIDSLRNPQ
jgi:hypothetical protein